MRITNNMLVNNMMNNIGNNLARMEKYQNQLSSGKKIVVPSDDPVVAARALKLKTDVSQVTQFKSNLIDAQSWMSVSETALADAGDVLQRVRELAVQAANGTTTATDTKFIGNEVEQLKGQLIHLSNSTYAGRYVFSGFSTNQKLINDDPNDPNYGKFETSVNNGDSIMYEIGIGDSINVNVPGGEVFNRGINSVGGSKGITSGDNNISSLTIGVGNDTLRLSVDGSPNFSISITNKTYADNEDLAKEIQSKINAQASTYGFKDVSVDIVGDKLNFTSGSKGLTSKIIIDTNPVTSNASASLGVDAVTSNTGTDAQKGELIQDIDDLLTALNSGNHIVIGSFIDKMDEQVSNVLRVRADVGARQNRLELTANRLDNDSVNFTKLMSGNEDVDMAETIMNLQNEENIYKAALAGGAKVIQPSLLDFLR